MSDVATQLAKYGFANTFEQKTQIPKTYGVIGAAVVVLISLLINALAHPISNLVGFALPALLSIKAIESPGNEDNVQWLTYWVVFGVRVSYHGLTLHSDDLVIDIYRHRVCGTERRIVLSPILLRV